MAVDLHTHSTASDGSDSPAALIQAAAALRLEAIALTDHDTLAGIPAARRAAATAGLEFVPGTEISCEWEPGSMHLVVLFLEPVSGPLQDRLQDLQAARDARNERIVERLHQLGIDVSLAEVHQEAGEGSVGRPHLAAVLVQKGVVESIPAAFDELLAKGRPAYVERERLTPEEAIRPGAELGGGAGAGTPSHSGPHLIRRVRRLLRATRRRRTDRNRVLVR